MEKILVIDDDDAMRGLIKARLSDSYEVIDTANPVRALELALEHKPRAILLDLMMQERSGFELCESFHNLSYTSRIPILIISGESAAKYREYMSNLGATGYFEKPIDFTRLKKQLEAELSSRRSERRAHIRVRMRIILKLKGSDESQQAFEQLTTTENVSAGGFLCVIPLVLPIGSPVQVFLSAPSGDQYAGRARVVRREAPNAPWQRYAFQFTECSPAWILQD
jgi:DNA-binding response OmpR family regulator